MQREVFCHGYGPKPHWKDKGEKEKREAARLALSSRRQSQRSISRGDSDGEVASPLNHVLDSLTSPSGPEVLCGITPTNTDLPSWPFSPLSCSIAASTNVDQEEQQDHIFGDLDNLLDFSALAAPHSGPSAVPYVSHALPSSASLHEPAGPPYTDSLSAPSTGAQRHDPVGLHDVQANLVNLIVPPVTALTSEHAEETLSREHDLVMHFLDDYSPRLGFQDSNRGWLLYLLSRSRAFLQCSLSMAARRESCHFLGGSEPLKEAQRYRACATQLFAELQAGTFVVLGEDLIVAMHLAHLEVCLALAYHVSVKRRSLDSSPSCNTLS